MHKKVDERVMSSLFFLSSRSRHTMCALVTGVQTCALPISTLRPATIWDISAWCRSARPGRKRGSSNVTPVIRPIAGTISGAEDGMITIEADWLDGFFRLAVIILELAGTLTILTGATLATILFANRARSEEHTSELQSLIRIQY